ncbi:MAG: sigma 54-interacting transcriptional regulator [Myxococcales bacterium]|nr:sigma 54-interacting transcriptional regulator [Myxococcales bacterium]
MSDDPLATLGRLRAVHPIDLHWSAMVRRSTMVLGRIEAQTVQLVLTHGTVSRRHFEVSWNEATGQHQGRDLGSHNGSRIDGRDIGQGAVPLRDGAVIQLGDVCLVYERMPPGLVEPPASVHEPIPGVAPQIVALRQAMARAAADPAPVLVRGESGTGKGYVAQELHRQSGRRGPLVTIDCSAPRAELERQFLGEPRSRLCEAEGGTLVLDTIGDLPQPLQSMLLRTLEEGRLQPGGAAEAIPLDVRVIATTPPDLERRVGAGGFRRDLYEHLGRWTLQVPPLRERRGDLLLCLQYLHARWLDRRPEHPVDTLTLSAEAAEAVLLYDWPDNLRELDRLVHELATAPHLPRPIPRSRLPNWVRHSDPLLSDARITAEVGPPASLEALRQPAPTREEFIEVFERLEGDVRAMARHFARDRRQIYRWIQSHGLSARQDDGG